VQLFAQSAFSGEPKNFGYDIFNEHCWSKYDKNGRTAEITEYGINRDDLSSIVVGPGVEAILKNIKGGGRGYDEKILGEGRHDLDSIGWNDITDDFTVTCMGLRK